MIMDNEFRFSVDVQIRMSDMDPFAHVNNGSQCHLFDYGRTAYIEHVFEDKINWMTLDLVIVHLELDFLSPVEAGDQVVCDGKIYEIGNKSLKMIQQLRDKRTGQVKTICKSVISGFDRKTRKSIPIQESYKEKIRAFEGI